MLWYCPRYPKKDFVVADAAIRSGHLPIIVAEAAPPPLCHARRWRRKAAFLSKLVQVGGAARRHETELREGSPPGRRRAAPTSPSFTFWRQASGAGNVALIVAPFTAPNAPGPLPGPLRGDREPFRHPLCRSGDAILPIMWSQTDPLTWSSSTDSFPISTSSGRIAALLSCFCRRSLFNDLTGPLDSAHLLSDIPGPATTPVSHWPVHGRFHQALGRVALRRRNTWSATARRSQRRFSPRCRARPAAPPPGS